MDLVRISNYGFPGAITELVARATMQLPPMTGPNDGEFILDIAAQVTSIFWANFISDLPGAAQVRYLQIMEKGDLSALKQWTQEYAEIEKDTSAQQRANRVLADLVAKLPALMAEEYTRFQSNSRIEQDLSSVA